MSWLITVVIVSTTISIALFALDYARACRLWVSTIAGASLAIALVAGMAWVLPITWSIPRWRPDAPSAPREASAPAQHPRVTTCPHCGYTW
jgi:hypothetical protein